MLVRFEVPVTLCFSIIADSQREAIRRANNWREKCETANKIPGLLVEEEELHGAMMVAVYLGDDFERITSDNILTVL